MTTLTVPGTVTTRRSSRLMWAILGLVLLANALDVIDATVTNIAAPTIARDLNGGESLIKCLGPAYMLAMGVLLVVPDASPCRSATHLYSRSIPDRAASTVNTPPGGSREPCSSPVRISSPTPAARSCPAASANAAAGSSRS
jgi:hypothetical protein